MINRRRSGARGTPAKVNVTAGLAAGERVNSTSVSDGSHERVVSCKAVDKLPDVSGRPRVVSSPALRAAAFYCRWIHAKNRKISGKVEIFAMLGTPFRCNICGTHNAFHPEDDWRESPTCTTCFSSVRSRHTIYCLTERLFGKSCALADIEAGTAPIAPSDLKRLRGVGLSDWIGLAEPLSRIFDYSNTYYHEEPFLDICSPGPRWNDFANFMISSDVFEHVPSPSIRAFEGAAKVLVPGGVLVLTVPFGGLDFTIEHYPDVLDFKVVEFDGQWLLIGRTESGDLQLHRSPVFHGGPGTTVEMRIFAYNEVVDLLKRSGFSDIRLHEPPVPEWGIFMPHSFGLPITAIKN